ncbi:type II toxin-antitoxin system HicB family antitoxin [Bradyrhizobium sp. BEA-2-5]|nr:type II toxin-antitoxin system HicB family antitoxin [Bradyrhizobium sp. BEA-2-5]WOH82267.1 type II toxin-antitoxin system HicB family antitoxin [Bradyrhizobium sp. BEA-2-5]
MKRRLYPAVLERGPRGAFGAWFPDFPGCVAAGRSQEDAIERAEQTLAQTVDGWVEHGKPLPEPTPIERIVVPKGSDVAAFFIVGVDPPDPSERVNVYLPKSLIARIDKRAAELGMSRSSFFGFASSLALEWPGGYPRGAPIAPRSRVHKTGALRAEKRPGKKPAR